MGYDINVGSAAIDRYGTTTPGYTWVDKNNRANAKGTLTRKQLFINTAIAGICKVGLFSAVGNYLTCKQRTAIATPGIGLQEFTVSLPVEIGDYIGIYHADGKVDMDIVGGDGVWFLANDQMNCVNVEFNFEAGFILSEYGQGIALKGAPLMELLGFTIVPS